MKIVFDARWIKRMSSGIGVYAREMMRHLPALAPDCEFVFLFQSQESADDAFLNARMYGNTRAEIVPFGPMSFKNQLQLPKLLNGLDADVFHSPNYMIPYYWKRKDGKTRGRIIANVHDVIPLAVEDYAPRSLTSKFKFLYKYCLRRTVGTAATVITGSASARNDLIRILKLPEKAQGKIRVIWDGADGEGAQPSRVSFDADDSRPRRLLYVGRSDPYKNVAGLVRAFADAQKRVPFTLKLYIAGAPDPRYPEAQEEAEELGVGSDVVFTGHISDSDLAALYRESDLLTHFSSYEGFGLPIVEAMRAGLPVVCTDGGSQPEVAGGAAEIVKAGDELSLAGAIADILSSPEKLLAMRTAGLARAKIFSWEKCAQETAKALTGV